MIRADNALSYAFTARRRGDVAIPDAGALDHVKWDMQSEVAGFSPALTKPDASGNMNPTKMAVWWKVGCDAEAVGTQWWGTGCGGGGGGARGAGARWGGGR